MATQLIVAGSTEANSPDITVTSGAPVTVCLKGTDSKSSMAIQLKDDGNGWQNVGGLSNAQPAVCLSGPGVYRLFRAAGSTGGAFSA